MASMKVILRPGPSTIRMLSALALHIHLKSPHIKTVRGESRLKSVRAPDKEFLRVYPFRHHTRVHRMIDDRQMHPNATHIARLHFKSNRSRQG
jgi:hypothetical protein